MPVGLRAQSASDSQGPDTVAETNDKKASSAAALQPSKTQSGDLVVAFSGDWELGQTLPETRPLSAGGTPG
jgi:hypothetical protein